MKRILIIISILILSVGFNSSIDASDSYIGEILENNTYYITSRGLKVDKRFYNKIKGHFNDHDIEFMSKTMYDELLRKLVLENWELQQNKEIYVETNYLENDDGSISEFSNKVLLSSNG